jgi:hypothetical protein
MKVGIAYIEEPPFYWTGEDHRVTGADGEEDPSTTRTPSGSMVTCACLSGWKTRMI